MSNVIILNQNRVDSGIQTATYTVPSGGAGPYYVSFKATEIPPSNLSIVVNQNGSPVFTSPALGQTQSALQFRYSQLYSVGDVITVVMSASDANDTLLNSIKSNVSIGQGAQ